MFVVASTGRCATHALCHGLDRYSDHHVEHEPEPRLLHEAQLKHRGLPYSTPTLRRRLELFAERDESAYGLSLRAAPLLPDIRAAAPHARFLILVRPPLEYVVSAHAKKVLRRGDEWDRLRIMPDGDGAARPLAERLAQHWAEVNRYLLDFAAEAGDAARVRVVDGVEHVIDDWVAFLGVRVVDHAGLRRFLASRPNAAHGRRRPPGFDRDRLAEIAGPVWERARAAAGGR